jgi:hypothetical protein
MAIALVGTKLGMTRLMADDGSLCKSFSRNWPWTLGNES